MGVGGVAGGVVPPQQPFPPPPPPPPLPSQLDLLNNSPHLTIPLSNTLLTNSLTPDPSPPPPPLSQIINSSYHDFDSLYANFSSNKHPLIMSLNIQSLQSKFDNLKSFIKDINNAKIPLIVLALQETWTIPHTKLINIPGFSFIHAQRHGRKGGGVGFFIRDDINYKIDHHHSPFIPFSFECLTIEITFNNKKTSITSNYKLPNPPRNCTSEIHHTSFLNP